MQFLKMDEKDYWRLKLSFWASLAICLAAHGFTYANATFFHDRRAYAWPIEFTSAQRTKWLAQFWDYLFHFSYLPWLSGVLIILFFAVSIYIIADALETRHASTIWLIAGICIISKTVISAHMYWPHNMIAALFLALISVWTWKHEKIQMPIRVVLGAIAIACSLATYGSYTSTAPFVIMIILLCSMIDGEKAKKVFLRGLEYVGTFLLGMAIYYIVLRLFLYFQGLEIYNYLNEARLIGGFPTIGELLQLMNDAYRSALDYILQSSSLRMTAVLVGVLFVLKLLLSGLRYSITDFAMMGLLIILMPLCIGAIYIMSFGSIHSLMEYTYDIFPVLAIALIDRIQYKKITRADFHRTGLGMSLSIIAIASIALLISRPVGTTRGGCIAIVAYILVYVIGVCAYHYICMHKNTKERMDKKETRFIIEGLRMSISNSKTILIVPSVVVLVLCCAGIYRGILSSNLAYMRVDKIDIETKAITNRMMARVENCDGFEGSEEIIFVGEAMLNPYISSENDDPNDPIWSDPRLKALPPDPLIDDPLLEGIITVEVARNGITYPLALPSLLQTSAGNRLLTDFYRPELYSANQQQQIREMSIYPADGSVQKVGETIVIKFQELPEEP